MEKGDGGDVEIWWVVFFKPTVNIHRPGQVRLLCNHYLKGYIIINLNMFSILLLTVLPEFQGHC